MLALALRWVLDGRACGARSGAPRSPEQLAPLDDVVRWTLDDETERAIDDIVRVHVTDPVGRRFMAPPPRVALRHACEDPGELS